jgi:hypothetical protein
VSAQDFLEGDDKLSNNGLRVQTRRKLYSSTDIASLFLLLSFQTESVLATGQKFLS